MFGTKYCPNSEAKALLFIKARCGLQLVDLAEGEPHVESVERQMAQLCAKIDSEARTLAENDFPKEARDLFMEQGKSTEPIGTH